MRISTLSQRVQETQEITKLGRDKLDIRGAYQTLLARDLFLTHFDQAQPRVPSFDKGPRGAPEDSVYV